MEAIRHWTGWRSMITAATGVVAIIAGGYASNAWLQACGAALVFIAVRVALKTNPIRKRQGEEV